MSRTRNILTGPGEADEGGDAWREGSTGIFEYAGRANEGAGFSFPPYTWPDPASIPRLRWLLGHHYLIGSVTILAAMGGLSKTSLIVASALSVAFGKPLLGLPVYEGAQNVLIWGLEDDLEQLARQVSAAVIAHGLNPADCVGRLYIASGMGGLGEAPMPLVTATQDDGTFRLAEDVFVQIEAALIAHEISLLIIDPFVSSHHARENETEVMDRIVKRWALVAKRCNCSIELVHHTRKTNGERAGIDAVRGSIAGVNAARVVLLLNRMTVEEAAAFGIDDQERRRMFCIDLAKANRSRPEDVRWYRMESVSLGNGGGAADDEVGAVMPWQPPSMSDEFTAMQLEMVRTAIRNGSHRASSASPRWAGHAIGQALGVDSKGEQGRERLKMLLRAWLSEGKLVKVSRYDTAARKVFDHIELGQADWGLSGDPE